MLLIILSGTILLILLTTQKPRCTHLGVRRVSDEQFYEFATSLNKQITNEEDPKKLVPSLVMLQKHANKPLRSKATLDVIDWFNWTYK